MLYKFIFFISRLVREFKMFVNFDKNFFYFNEKRTWEFIPRMSDKRLNQINNDLKSGGLKCSKIQMELRSRRKYTGNLDKAGIAKVNRCSKLFLDATVPVIAEDKALTNVLIHDSLYAYSQAQDDNKQHVYTFNKVTPEALLEHPQQDVNKTIDDLFDAIDPLEDDVDEQYKHLLDPIPFSLDSTSEEYWNQIKDSEYAALHEQGIDPNEYFGADFNPVVLEEQQEFKFNKKT